MTSQIVCVTCGESTPNLPGDHTICYVTAEENLTSPCHRYQGALERLETDVLIYVHDDLDIYNPEWLANVMFLFSYRPDIVAVGLGGAARLGNWDLYRKPYSIHNMARFGYVSNQTDWETHGGHCQGSGPVAVVDAFFMAIRRDWLMSCGGWPTEHLTHHCLDLWLACEARRRGNEIWMVGESCTHHGGRTSTSARYAQAPWLQGGTLAEDHARPHRWLWNEYRDVLPIERVV